MPGSERSTAIFEYAAEGILITSGDGTIVLANPAAERLFGYEKGELNGASVDTLIPSRFSKHHPGLRKNYIDAPQPRSMGSGRDLFALRKDGSEFPVEISLSPYQSEEGPMVIAFVVDISLRKAAENKLKNHSIELEQQVMQRTLILSEAINELEKTKEELHDALIKEKELNDLKSRFVSMVSHEFRTPLATILSSLSLVRKYGEIKEPAKQEKHLERIRTAVNNLTDMLNDVLSLSKLEEGLVMVNPEPLDVPAFVAEAAQEMQVVALPGQLIRYSHSGDTGLVMMDKKILRHILFNLISNAIKFSPEKSPIDIRTLQDDDSLELHVQDHGIGIDEEDQIQLFERFFRARNAVNIQGTGLGLNIVSRYIDLLSGSIRLQSRLGEGTLFIIRIPIPVL